MNRKFKVGDRVRMSAEAVRQGLNRRSKFGTVTSVTLSLDHCVQVLVDGYVYPTRYHQDFWEPVIEPQVEEKMLRGIKEDER